MKLKTLANLCKRRGSFRLYDRVDENGEVLGQWLGTGGAVYPLVGLPYLTEDHLVTMFDITEKQRENLFIGHDKTPPHINFSHADEKEYIIDPEKFTLGYDNHIVKPLITRRGLALVDCDWLTPLSDVEDNLELYAREDPSGQIYFAAKLGLMVVGIIMPMKHVEARIAHAVEDVAGLMRAALVEAERREGTDDAES